MACCNRNSAGSRARKVRTALSVSGSKNFIAVFWAQRHKQANAPRSGVPTGIRTPVLTVKGWCPRPLDDGDVSLKSTIPARSTLKTGGARRDRTADLLHAMQALSQLSYGPLFVRYCILRRN